MEQKGKTAIVLGATGLVGGILLDLLLQDERYENVLVFSRRQLKVAHPKLKVYLGDLFEMERFSSQFQGNHVFCCVGSTQAKTPDMEIYKKVDYGIPLAAAKLCKQKDISTLVIVSALGANAKSSLFYNRIKGEMEEDILALNIEKAHFVQPALIGGDRTEKRPGEYFFKKVLTAVDVLMVGPLKKYKIIMPETIAKAMVWLANNSFDKKQVSSQTLKELASHGAS